MSELKRAVERVQEYLSASQNTREKFPSVSRRDGSLHVAFSYTEQAGFSDYPLLEKDLEALIAVAESFAKEEARNRYDEEAAFDEDLDKDTA